MALNTNIKFLHPANWDGNPPENGGWKKVILLLTGYQDDTIGPAHEVDTVKLDLSELRNLDGVPPQRTVVEYIKWTVDFPGPVKLEWDRAPESIIAILPDGTGKITHPIVDPGEAGDRTGDILLTTNGGSYSIEMCVRLK